MAVLWVVWLGVGCWPGVAAAAETTWFVRDGAAVEVEDVEDAWRAGEDGWTATGEQSRLDMGRCVGPGDFEVYAELKLDDLARDNAALMVNAAGALESGELIFSRGGRVVVRGFFFGDRTQTVRPVDGLLRSGEWFTLRVRREADTVTFRLNGEPVWTMRYEGDRPFGKLTLKPGAARLTVRTCWVRGETTPLADWVPLLEREHAIGGEAHTDVFVSGRDGYHTYRIPAIVRAPGGALLAFAEGRKTSHHDRGDVDLVLRRSEDGGRTWLPMQLVYEEGGTARITIGNPVPVVDRDTGRVWLFFCRDNRDVLAAHSDDAGRTWAEPIDLTATLKRDDWGGWYATGPCHGIQLSGGRLIVPANHGTARGTQAHLIVSDDHGETWRIGGMAEPGTNETAVEALPGNRVYANMRISSHRNGQPYCRKAAWSHDGGESFGPTRYDHSLIGPICQAALLSLPGDGADGLLLFSNPRSQRRERMTVRASLDGGQTWSEGLRIYEGSSAYSDLVRVDDDTAGLLFERDLYGAITFVRFRPEAAAAPGGLTRQRWPGPAPASSGTDPNSRPAGPSDRSA